MSEAAHDVGRAALAAALARAGRRASTAVAVAALVPLALMAAAPTASATVSEGPPGSTDYTYDLSSLGNGDYTRLEIPELQAGEFLGSEGSILVTGLPSGWEVSQQSTSAFSSGGATFKSQNDGTTPAAYIEVTDVSGTFLSGGSSGGLSSIDFTLYSDYPNSIGANVVLGASAGGEGEFTIDPPTPNPAPEPGSLALIGTALAGLAALRRRKKT